MMVGLVSEHFVNCSRLKVNNSWVCAATRVSFVVLYRSGKSFFNVIRPIFKKKQTNHQNTIESENNLDWKGLQELLV